MVGVSKPRPASSTWPQNSVGSVKMTGNQKTFIVLAVSLAIFTPLLLMAIGILVYVRRTRESLPQPKGDEDTPQANWVELIPKSYWVIGPFGPGLDKAYEPEQMPDPTKPCQTPAGNELQWVVKPVIPGALCLDFRKALAQTKTDNAAAYALVYVHSPKDQAGELLLGSDDTITVWLNGAQVHENRRLRTGVPDDDKAPVTWKQGRNSLLIKVGNATGDHLFFAKLRSPSEMRATTTKDLE